jgi:AcrR family transcriptional regulator
MAQTTRRGRPPLTEEQRAEQRRQLLEGAMDAIRAHGPEVSVDEIAATAGVSKPVLYGHFGDRLGLADAIAVAVADDVITLTVDRAVEGAADGLAVDFPAAIAAIVASLVDVVEQEPEIYGFLVRAIRSGERGFFDNPLVEVIRDRGGRLAEAATPGLDAEMRRVMVDGAFGFLLFAIESWKPTRTPPRAELVGTLTDAVAAGFVAASQPRPEGRSTSGRA